MKNQALKSSVSFFPVPLPDELLDSVVYRYHHLSGLPNPAITLETLFGKSVNVAPKLLVNRLDFFWERAVASQFENTDDLINRLTLLPAFGTILDKEQMRSARAASCGGLNLGTATMYRSPIHVIEPELQSCPMCVNEEFDRLGVAYWHRSHQLNGVKVCHHHGCDMQSACRHCKHPIRRPRSMDLPKPFCPSCNRPQLAVFSYPEHVQSLAALASQALAGGVPFCDRRLLATKVRELVGDETAEACDQMRNLYGPKYVDQAPAGYYSLQGDWLEFGLRVKRTIQGNEYGVINLPTLGHMLMVVDFLFGSWEPMEAKAQSRKRSA